MTAAKTVALSSGEVLLVRKPKIDEPAPVPMPATSLLDSKSHFDTPIKYMKLPAISKRFANKMIFLVVPVLSDQCPNKGPDRRPLRLNADRAKPKKYGGASKVCKYLHIVGNMTAYSIPLRRNISPMVKKVSFLFR